MATAEAPVSDEELKYYEEKLAYAKQQAEEQEKFEKKRTELREKEASIDKAEIRVLFKETRLKQNMLEVAVTNLTTSVEGVMTDVSALKEVKKNAEKAEDVQSNQHKKPWWKFW